MTDVLERPEVAELPEIVESTVLDTPWLTIVWNDPVNLMSYVSYVFRSYFGFSTEEAERRMLQVHHDGRAVVATGSREEMERHVEAMHDFGLWATLAKADDA
jgi:ATP-dependent Clp protease adaptor protein ClpS